MKQTYSSLIVGTLLTGAATIAAAQTFPSRAVTVVIPFPPGGISDNSLNEFTDGYFFVPEWNNYSNLCESIFLPAQ